MFCENSPILHVLHPIVQRVLRHLFRHLYQFNSTLSYSYLYHHVLNYTPLHIQVHLLPLPLHNPIQYDCLYGLYYESLLYFSHHHAQGLSTNRHHNDHHHGALYYYGRVHLHTHRLPLRRQALVYSDHHTNQSQRLHVCYAPPQFCLELYLAFLHVLLLFVLQVLLQIISLDRYLFLSGQAHFKHALNSLLLLPYPQLKPLAISSTLL